MDYCIYCGNPKADGISDYCSNECARLFYDYGPKAEYEAWLDGLPTHPDDAIDCDPDSPDLPDGDVDHDEEDRVAYEMEKIQIRCHRPSDY